MSASTYKVIKKRKIPVLDTLSFVRISRLIELVMSIEWMVKEKQVKYLTIILGEVDYFDYQKQMLELCTNKY